MAKRKIPKPSKRVSTKKVKENVAKRPDRRELKSIYRGLLSTDVNLRIDSLSKALRWYDQARLWARNDPKKSKKVLTENLRLFDKSDGLRQRATNVNNLKEREVSLKEAVTYCELALDGIVATKPVEMVYEKLAKIEDKLKKKSEKLTAKYQTILTTLQDALRPENKHGKEIALKVSESQEKARTISGDVRTMSYSKEHAKGMVEVFRKKGLLPLAYEEIKQLYIPMGCDMNPQTNQWSADWHACIGAIEKLYKNLIDYVETNPKLGRRLIRAKRKPRQKKGKKK